MNSYKVDEIKSLVKELNKASHEYYNNNNSIMTDKEFDKKIDKLRLLEEETGVILSSSPTQNVGYDIVEGLKKVEHKTPLLSLDKTKSKDNIVSFAKKNDSFISIKLDGLTVKLIYENGRLVQASTRGNGEIGEDITHNAKIFKNIPLTISHNEHLEITGEAIIHKNDFEEINRVLSDEDKYKTPRNLASGSIRQLDSSIARDRRLHFYCFNVLDGIKDTSKIKRLELAKKLGFDVVEYVSIDKNEIDTESIGNTMQKLKDYANEKYLPIDGLVISYDDISYSKSLGQTSHHYNDGLAFKEEDETEETILRSIDWSVSRTGTINPVAIFDTVILDGTDVSKASLSNISIIEELGLLAGDRILVSKRNQIIPHIEDNLDRYDNFTNHEERKYLVRKSIPSLCPSCYNMTTIDESGNSKVLKCNNTLCKSKISTRIKHYASRNCMNIDGLSESTIEKFMDLGVLNSFLDIYKLKNHREELILLEGFGEKSIDKLIVAIEKSKECKLESFISALGIPNIGQSSSKTIAKQFNYSFNELFEALNQGYNFTRLQDFGQVVNESIYRWFNNLEERKECQEIAKLLRFIKPSNDDSTIVSDIFKGKKIVITGKFINYTRDKLKEKVEILGGKIIGSVSKSTDVLIYGDKAGSKLDKAKELGIELLTENELYDIINK